MAFNWLNNFQQEMEKPPDYAAKTLAAYKLGMKAKGSIVGVRIVVDAHGCEASLSIDQTQIFHPDNTPILPLPGCDKSRNCRCVYRPVMTYELEEK